MKELLDCNNLEHYDQILEDYSKIRVGKYDEYKLKNKIKERRFQWLGGVGDYLLNKIHIHERIKRYPPYEEFCKIEIKELEQLKKIN